MSSLSQPPSEAAKQLAPIGSTQIGKCLGTCYNEVKAKFKEENPGADIREALKANKVPPPSREFLVESHGNQSIKVKNADNSVIAIGKCPQCKKGISIIVSKKETKQ